MPTNRLCPRLSWRRGAWVWGLLLGLLVLPVPARAEVSPDVRRYLMSINRLIEDLEHERALEQIVRAKKVSKGPEDDVAVSLYEGVVLAELSQGRQAESDAAFKSALFLNPDAKLPLTVSPKLRERFESVRQKVLKELAVRGETPDALKVKAPEPARAVASNPVELSMEAEGQSSLRARAWIPAVVGGVLAAGGGVVWFMAAKEKSRLKPPVSFEIRTEADARAVASRTRSLQSASVGLWVGGAVGLGVATGMYLLGAPEPGPLALTVGTDGTSAFVAGRWP
ncbi:hypothetical protein [Myxococcus qinghaiensis]|uniref:hypothetical protein n=1 Tax=Myxococcus qinghaiensis TaxID=2906758 RepID=UPI0021154BAC|nr:hypothetical protein [Myxococcus qinghaiensis]